MVPLLQNVKKVSSKHLHQVLPHVQQRFVKVRQDEKAGTTYYLVTSTTTTTTTTTTIGTAVFIVSVVPERLLNVMEANAEDVFMVFCNTVSSCDWTAQHLQSHGITLIKLHGGFSAVVKYSSSPVLSLAYGDLITLSE